MSVVKTVGRGVAWNSIATFVGKAVTIANIFIILRSLTVYEYGFNELVMTVISTVGVVLLPGLVNAIVADLAVERGRENLAKMKYIFFQYFYLNLALGFLAWAILYFGALPIAVHAGNAYAAQFLKIASFLFLISPVRTISITLATVMLRYFEQTFYGVFEEFFKMMLVLLLIVDLHLGIKGLIYSIVLSQLFVVLLYLPRTISAYNHFSDAEAKSGLYFWNVLRGHRKWSIASSYVGTLTQNVRIWIIKALLGTEAVGMFAFAYGVMNHVTSLVPLTSVITPIIPHYIDRRDQLMRIVRASVKLQAAISVALVALAFIVSDEVVHIFFPNYIKAIPLVYVMLLSTIPNGVVGVFTPVFNAYKEQRSLFESIIFKAILMSVILAPAIWLFGLVGPGVELVLTTLLNAVERDYRLKRLLPDFTLGIRDLFTPDAYEREAMQMVIKGLTSRSQKQRSGK